MNKNNFAEKLFIIFGNIDIALMVIDMTLVPWNINNSILAKEAKYLHSIDRLIILPAVVLSLIVLITDNLIGYIIKRKLKDNFIFIQFCFVEIIWFIYMIIILLLSLFYEDFGDIVYKIVNI